MEPSSSSAAVAALTHDNSNPNRNRGGDSRRQSQERLLASPLSPPSDGAFAMPQSSGSPLPYGRRFSTEESLPPPMMSRPPSAAAAPDADATFILEEIQKQFPAISLRDALALSQLLMKDAPVSFVSSPTVSADSSPPSQMLSLPTLHDLHPTSSPVASPSGASMPTVSAISGTSPDRSAPPHTFPTRVAPPPILTSAFPGAAAAVAAADGDAADAPSNSGTNSAPRTAPATQPAASMENSAPCLSVTMPSLEATASFGTTGMGGLAHAFGATSGLSSAREKRIEHWRSRVVAVLHRTKTLAPSTAQLPDAARAAMLEMDTGDTFVTEPFIPQRLTKQRMQQEQEQQQQQQQQQQQHGEQQRQRRRQSESEPQHRQLLPQRSTQSVDSQRRSSGSAHEVERPFSNSIDAPDGFRRHSDYDQDLRSRTSSRNHMKGRRATVSSDASSNTRYMYNAQQHRHSFSPLSSFDAVTSRKPTEAFDENYLLPVSLRNRQIMRQCESGSMLFGSEDSVRINNDVLGGDSRRASAVLQSTVPGVETHDSSTVADGGSPTVSTGERSSSHPDEANAAESSSRAAQAAGVREHQEEGQQHTSDGGQQRDEQSAPSSPHAPGSPRVHRNHHDASHRGALFTQRFSSPNAEDVQTEEGNNRLPQAASALANGGGSTAAESSASAANHSSQSEYADAPASLAAAARSVPPPPPLSAFARHNHAHSYGTQGSAAAQEFLNFSTSLAALSANDSAAQYAPVFGAHGGDATTAANVETLDNGNSSMANTVSQAPLSASSSAYGILSDVEAGQPTGDTLIAAKTPANNTSGDSVNTRPGGSANASGAFNIGPYTSSLPAVTASASTVAAGAYSPFFRVGREPRAVSPTGAATNTGGSAGGANVAVPDSSLNTTTVPTAMAGGGGGGGSSFAAAPGLGNSFSQRGMGSIGGWTLGSLSGPRHSSFFGTPHHYPGQRAFSSSNLFTPNSTSTSGLWALPGGAAAAIGTNGTPGARSLLAGVYGSVRNARAAGRLGGGSGNGPTTAAGFTSVAGYSFPSGGTGGSSAAASRRVSRFCAPQSSTTSPVKQLCGFAEPEYSLLQAEEIENNARQLCENTYRNLFIELVLATGGGATGGAGGAPGGISTRSSATNSLGGAFSAPSGAAAVAAAAAAAAAASTPASNSASPNNTTYNASGTSAVPMADLTTPNYPSGNLNGGATNNNNNNNSTNNGGGGGDRPPPSANEVYVSSISTRALTTPSLSQEASLYARAASRVSSRRRSSADTSLRSYGANHTIEMLMRNEKNAPVCSIVVECLDLGGGSSGTGTCSSASEGSPYSMPSLPTGRGLMSGLTSPEADGLNSRPRPSSPSVANSASPAVLSVPGKNETPNSAQVLNDVSGGGAGGASAGLGVGVSATSQPTMLAFVIGCDWQQWEYLLAGPLAAPCAPYPQLEDIQLTEEEEAECDEEEEEDERRASEAAAAATDSPSLENEVDETSYGEGDMDCAAADGHGSSSDSGKGTPGENHYETKTAGEAPPPGDLGRSESANFVKSNSSVCEMLAETTAKVPSAESSTCYGRVADGSDHHHSNNRTPSPQGVATDAAAAADIHTDDAKTTSPASFGNSVSSNQFMSQTRRPYYHSVVPSEVLNPSPSPSQSQSQQQQQPPLTNQTPTSQSQQQSRSQSQNHYQQQPQSQQQQTPQQEQQRGSAVFPEGNRYLARRVAKLREAERHWHERHCFLRLLFPSLTTGGATSGDDGSSQASGRPHDRRVSSFSNNASSTPAAAASATAASAGPLPRPSGFGADGLFADPIGGTRSPGETTLTAEVEYDLPERPVAVPRSLLGLAMRVWCGYHAHVVAQVANVLDDTQPMRVFHSSHFWAQWPRQVPPQPRRGDRLSLIGSHLPIPLLPGECLETAATDSCAAPSTSWLAAAAGSSAPKWGGDGAGSTGANGGTGTPTSGAASQSPSKSPGADVSAGLGGGYPLPSPAEAETDSGMDDRGCANEDNESNDPGVLADTTNALADDTEATTEA